MKAHFLLLVLGPAVGLVSAWPSATDTKQHYQALDPAISMSLTERSSSLDELKDAVMNVHGVEASLSQQDPLRQGRFDFAIKWLSRVSGPPGLGFSMYSLSKSCKSFNESHEVGDGVDCVSGAVFTTVSTIMCLHGFGEFAVALSDTLQTWTVNRAGEMVGDLINNIPIGPYYRSGNENNPNPMKRSSMIKLEGILSEKIGHQIRHIGMWDGIMPGTPGKRAPSAKTQRHPVFGFQREGQHFHIALTHFDHETGESHIQLGNGPGPSTVLNRRRLESRQDAGTVYNQQYFDEGGFEAFGRSNFDEADSLDVDDAANDLQWLYEEVMCSLEIDGPGSDHPGLWWSILDHENRATYATGGIAAFGPGVPSLIQSMTYEGHLPTIDECLVPDHHLSGDSR